MSELARKSFKTNGVEYEAWIEKVKMIGTDEGGQHIMVADADDYRSVVFVGKAFSGKPGDDLLLIKAGKPEDDNLTWFVYDIPMGRMFDGEDTDKLFWSTRKFGPFRLLISLAFWVSLYFSAKGLWAGQSLQGETGIALDALLVIIPLIMFNLVNGSFIAPGRLYRRIRAEGLSMVDAFVSGDRG